jgi:putative transcription factor
MDTKTVILRKRDANVIREVQKKNDAGKNKQEANKMNSNKLEKDTNSTINEDVDYKHQKVSSDLSKRIQKARTEKKLTQEQLAKLLSMNVGIIKSYENGTAIPNGVVLSRIKRALNITKN